MKRWRVWATTLVLVAIAGSAYLWQERHALHYLPADTTAFVARFTAPPPPQSPATRAELDGLLAIQAARTPQDVAAARADRKTEIARFYGALGFPPGDEPDLPRLELLAEHVEDDVRLYVRAAKDHFRRLRPFVIEPRLEPCIDDVQGDLSYPSGHAAYAWSMAYLLSLIAPDRSAELERRAAEFARQRMVCGVHFPSDLAAGKAAARWLIDQMREVGAFNADLGHAGKELLDQRPAMAPAAKN